MFIDFFVHPILEPNQELRGKINLPHVIANMDKNKIAHAMVCSDTSIRHDRLSCSYMLELGKDIPEDVCSVTVHPYLQRIDKQKYSKVSTLVNEAEKQGMFICICTAYGSRDLYKYSGLELAAYLLNSGLTCPVVLIHAGGCKVLEAMLLAEAFPNVYLETSFSLHYWKGSSIETDIAFAMRKLGTHRWIFGSDAPFVPLDIAVKTQIDFLKKYHFMDRDIDRVMGGTAGSLLGV